MLRLTLFHTAVAYVVTNTQQEAPTGATPNAPNQGHAFLAEDEDPESFMAKVKVTAGASKTVTAKVTCPMNYPGQTFWAQAGFSTHPKTEWGSTPHPKSSADPPDARMVFYQNSYTCEKDKTVKFDPKDMEAVNPHATHPTWKNCHPFGMGDKTQEMANLLSPHFPLPKAVKYDKPVFPKTGMPLPDSIFGENKWHTMECAMFSGLRLHVLWTLWSEKTGQSTGDPDPDCSWEDLKKEAEKGDTAVMVDGPDDGAGDRKSVV